MQRQMVIGFMTLALSTLLLPFAISNIIVGCLFLLGIYYAVINKLKPSFGYSFWAFLLLFVLMIISYYWSIDRGKTLVAIFSRTRILLLPLLFSFIRKITNSERETILKTYANSILLFVVLVMLRAVYICFLKHTTSVFFHQKLVDFWMFNRVSISVFVAVALFIIIFYRKNINQFWLKVSVLFGFIILLSSKNVVIMTLLISGMLFWLQFHQKKMKIWLILLAIPFTTIVLLLSYKVNKDFFSEMSPRFSQILSSNQFGQNYYLNGAELRLLFSRFSYESLIEDNVLITGYGLGAADSKLIHKMKSTDLYSGYQEYNTHNQFVQYWLELGVFAPIILMFLIVLFYHQSIKQKNWLALAFIVLYTAYLFTDTPLYTQRGLYLFLMLYYIL